MWYDGWLAEREMNMHVRDARAQAETRRLVRLVRMQRNQGLSWELRWMMCRLGLRLVALGARIEAEFLPPAKSADTKVH